MSAKQQRAPKDRATLLRAVRWARLPGHGHTVAEARRRFGISASAWRKAAKELGDEAAIWSDEDLMLSGLHGGKATPVESLIFYYSWINHAGIRPAQVRAILRRLITKGLVRKVGDDRFTLACEWP